MRIPCLLSALIFCAAPLAYAQQSNLVRNPGGAPVRAVPDRMSFSYDASHNITASGVQLKTSTLKSNSVSPTTGTIVVTINIKLISRLQSGTTYHCSVNAIGGIIDLDTGTVDGGVESASNFASGSGGAYSCTLRIPYSWTLTQSSGADSGLILAFGVNAVNPQGDVPRSTLQVDGIENLPASGATASYVFNVAL
ncbi:MAG TPA: hypothetical protein VL346_07725 [Acidobacteriaceae bacterium]|nr:hypothetical protein [Acidobacteriaceae bacterium]